MRLLPAPMAVRIGTVAAAAAIAVVGATTVASASVPAGHAKQPQHSAGGAAQQRDKQRSAASASTSASPSPAASPSPVVKIPTALSIAVTGEVTHKQRTRAVIDGRLSESTGADQGVRGKVVFLLRQGADGHWFVVGQQFTGPNGGVAFRVRVFKSATFELAFRGTRHLAGAVSSTTTIS